MTELKILYTTNNEDTHITYLYNKDTNFLLPIESSKDLHDGNLACVLKSLFKIINVQDASFEIYRYQDDVFYSYLNLKTKKQSYKINCDPEVFSFFADKCRLPVYTKKRILEDVGIKISEEMLTENLEI